MSDFDAGERGGGLSRPPQRAHQPIAAPHVALISPYDAGNLGDAAILESIAGNLRALAPGCRFTAVTLAPNAMAGYHGLPGWPITGASIEFYAINPAAAPSGVEREPQAHAGPQCADGAQEPVERRSPGLLARLGRVPLIGPLLKGAREALRFGVADLRHWRASHEWLAGVSLVMVAGGGQFDDEWGGAWGHPYALFKWSVLARRRGLPFVIASVGVCRTQNRTARSFFARAMRNASWLSFRDAQSKERALAMEPRCPGRLVPDLAFALNPRSSASALRSTPGQRPLRIGVSPIAYGMPGVWPFPNEARFEHYLGVLLRLVESLRAQGHEVVMFTSERTDRDVVQRVRQHFDQSGAAPLECALPDRLNELLETLAGLDVIVTSRLHGVILSHVLGKPAAALSYDRKVRAHMQDMGQERYCLDIDSPELENALPMVQTLIAERIDAATSVRAALEPRRTQVVEQYSQLLRLGGAPVAN